MRSVNSPDLDAVRSPFMTTHWSVIRTARQDDGPEAAEALEKLCRAYWPPLYAYLRRSGQSPEDAKDLVQGLFALLLSEGRLALADPRRGRFRSFLLTALKNHMVNEWKKARRVKRGGDFVVLSLDYEKEEALYSRDLPDHLTPDLIYERRWARQLIDLAQQRLEAELAGNARKRLLLDLVSDSFWGSPPPVPFSEIAARVELSEGAAKTAASRLRHRFHAILRSLVAETLEHPADPAEVDAELRHLALQAHPDA